MVTLFSFVLVVNPLPVYPLCEKGIPRSVLSRAREVVRLEDRGEPIQARTTAEGRAEGPLTLSSPMVSRAVIIGYILQCHTWYSTLFLVCLLRFPSEYYEVNNIFGKAPRALPRTGGTDTSPSARTFGTTVITSQAK